MNLTLDDLFETCRSCKGTGKKSESPELNRGRRYGYRPSPSPGVDLVECEACDGYGRGRLTTSGQAILDFIRVVKKRGMI
jgi:hypothetical protein